MIRVAFEQLVRGLCSKWAEDINDPIYSYDDLLQEAHVLVWTLCLGRPNLKNMSGEDKEKYLFSAIKYHFISIAKRVKKCKEVEEKYLNGSNGI